VETRTSGSEGGPGKRVRLKGRHRALVRPYDNVVVWSVDEKSGMQATSRVNPTRAAVPGIPVRREFEYRRHGTAVLFAALNVHDGGVNTLRRRRRAGSAPQLADGILGPRRALLSGVQSAVCNRVILIDAVTV
jgi:hypothetical protein